MGISRRSVALLVTPLLLFALLPVLSAGKATTAQAASSTTFAFGWGDNSEGQLGNGLVADDSVPVSMGSGANANGTWQQIVIAPRSGSASCGIGGDDRAYCWGDNGAGQVGDGTETNRYGGPVMVADGANAGGTWKAITSGGSQWTCGIGSDDRAYCWGINSTYTGGPVDPGFLGNGTAGTTDDSVPRAVSNGANLTGTWKAISAGWPVTCGIGTNDRAYCWGAGEYRVLGNGTTASTLDDSVPQAVSDGDNTAGTWMALSVGNKAACGVGTDNKLYCWGSDLPSGGSSTPDLMANGDNASGTWKAISVGDGRICGIGGDDKGYCWGWGPSGNGTPDWSPTPLRVSIPGDPTVTSIATTTWGLNVSACAVAGGSVYCWGINSDGQLGDGQRPNSSITPVAVVSSGALNGRTLGRITAGVSSFALVTGPATATVTYDGNGATSGAPPAAATGTIGSNFTVAANSGSLARPGYTFAGWNINDQGTGTTYAAGTGTFTLTGSTTLYAEWEPLPPPPPPSPPGPPYLLTAEPGNRQVTLTWARPDWEGTSPVTAYRVYAAPGGLVCTVSVTTCTVEGLTNGQPYEFWVTAVNSVGESSPSRRLTAIPKPDPPGAPFLAIVTGGNAQAKVEWDAPADDGGSPVTEYRVFTGSGTRACTVSGLTEQCTVEGLTNGQRYEFWVTAVNSAGESPPSRRLSVTPVLALPGPPIEVAGTAGDKRIHWAWRPPEGEGSYPVERYQVILNPLLPTVGGIACTVIVPATSCTVPKLTPGTTYTARVRAWSKAGWGQWSTSSTGVKVPTPPPPGISVEVRRLTKDPDEVRVKGRTQGIKPGTELWVWIHRETEYGYLESFQGTARPVVDEDGDFIWERSAPAGRIWEVIWCTQPNVKGTCSRWTLL